MIYKSNDVYHLHKHTDDTIAKNIVYLNHNIHMNVVNNIT